MKLSPREVVNRTFCVDTENWNWEQVHAMAALDTAQTMLRIERALLALGADGIHGLIRRADYEHQQREVARLAKERAKRRRARERRKAAKGAKP